MYCNTTSSMCEYILCDDSISNGNLETESMPWLNGRTPPTALGHTAVVGCREGYVIDHPAKLTVLARAGYNIQGMIAMRESLCLKMIINPFNVLQQYYDNQLS